MNNLHGIKTNDFNIAHLNVRGMVSKIDEVKTLLSQCQFKVLCLSETFLKENIPNSYFDIQGYEVVREDRSGKNGGGLLCYIKSCVSYEKLSEIDDQSLCESVTIKMKSEVSKPFLVSFIYRPPDSKIEWNENFVRHVERCYEYCEEVIILGDFNVNLLDISVKQRWTQTVLDAVNLTQLISTATRISMTSATLIDHVYSSHPTKLTKYGVIDCSFSDHHLIYATRKVGIKKSGKRYKLTYIDYSKMTPENVTTVFSKVPWEYIQQTDDVSNMAKSFNDLFLEAASELVSTKSRYVKSDILPPWLDEEARQNMSLRDQLKRSKLWLEYKRQRNYVNNMIRNKKRNHIESLVKNSTNTNTKPIWDALNVSKPKSKEIDTDLSCDALNDHFVSIAKILTSHLKKPARVCEEIPPNLLSCVPEFTHMDLIAYLKDIPSSKATGVDNISVKMLKHTIPFVVEPICSMFNKILQQGEFPESWKVARVTPIFKEGDKNDPSNYRPISVLPIISKLFEKHINISLQTHLTENKIVHHLQCGFRGNHSCSDVVHKVVSDCLEFRSRNHFTSLLLLDFSKAFDCVDHEILSVKLKSCGISGQLLSLINSYLKDRMQFVSLKENFSKQKSIKVGVPQGSILAPTLFLIYINDLLHLPKFSESLAYADDTVFINHSPVLTDLQLCCESDLETIRKWCEDNRMVINMKKSHYLLVDRSSSIPESEEFELQYDNQALLRKSETKLLGFILVDTITWFDHIKYINSKISKNINLLRLCRPYIRFEYARIFYFQFIFCHLIYGICIYHNLAPDYATKSLYLQQKRALRIVADFHRLPCYLISTDILSKSLKLLKLPDLARYFTCILGFRIFHGTSPDFICASFDEAEHRFCFRDRFNLRTSKKHLESLISTTFNNLPFELKSLASFTTFKSSLYNYIDSS